MLLLARELQRDRLARAERYRLVRSAGARWRDDTVRTHAAAREASPAPIFGSGRVPSVTETVELRLRHARQRLRHRLYPHAACRVLETVGE